jgi:predicted ArsR family transcriptional regulator
MAMHTALALNTAIVTTLKEYGPIPVDFLAKLLGRRTAEILEYLESLEREGVVRRDGEKVSLVA